MKGWKVLKKSEIASKMYFLLLLKPLRIKDLAIIIYGAENRRRLIIENLQLFKNKFKCIKESAPEKVQRGNFYEAKLNLLFGFWEDSFKERKKMIKREIKKRPFQKIIKSFDTDLPLEGHKIRLKELSKKLKNVKPLTRDEKKELQNVWDTYKKEIRADFAERFLPYIRMSMIDWDVLVMLTDFWVDFITEVVGQRKIHKFKYDFDLGRLKLKGNDIDDKTKKRIEQSYSSIKAPSLEISKAIISDKRLEQILEYLDLCKGFNTKISNFYQEKD